MEASRNAGSSPRSAKSKKSRARATNGNGHTISRNGKVPQLLSDPSEIPEVPRCLRGVALGLKLGEMPSVHGDASGVIGDASALTKPVDLTGMVGRFVRRGSTTVFEEDLDALTHKWFLLKGYLRRMGFFEEALEAKAYELLPVVEMRRAFIDRQRSVSELRKRLAEKEGLAGTTLSRTLSERFGVTVS